MIAAGGRALRVAGLFAGIGGIELGLSAAGHEAVLLAELLPEARAVLAARMDASVVPDVREIADLPAEVDLLTAGFPCQDLSSVGRKGGISGTKSKLVGEVFRLIERRPVDWVVMENVPFLLHLDKGKAMRLVVGALEELGYAWVSTTRCRRSRAGRRSAWPLPRRSSVRTARWAPPTCTTPSGCRGSHRAGLPLQRRWPRTGIAGGWSATPSRCRCRRGWAGGCPSRVPTCSPTPSHRWVTGGRRLPTARRVGPRSRCRPASFLSWWTGHR